MISLSAIDVAHLTLWRELRARGPLLLILLGCLALDIVLPVRNKGPWEIFSLLIVLPPTAVALALRLPGGADSFWRGLGGSGVVRGAMTAAAHLVPLLVAALLLLWSLHGRDETLAVVVELPMVSSLYLATLVAIYALVFAGRAVAGGMATLCLLIAAGPTLWLVTLAARHINKWPTWHGLLWRICALAVLALLCGIALEGVVGVWGGAVRKRVPSSGALVALLLGIAGVGLAAEAAWPTSLAFPDGRWTVFAPDGSSAVMGWSDSRGLGMSRVMHWTPEDGVSWGSRHGGIVRPGPRGAWVAEDSVTWPNGAVTSCESDFETLWWTSWAADGESVILSTQGERRFALATPAGCTLLPRGTRGPGFLPDGGVVFVQNNELFAGESIANATRVPVPGHDPTAGRLDVSSTIRSTYVVLRGGGHYTVWQLRDGELTPLTEGEGKVRVGNECVWRVASRFVNGPESSKLSCWTPAGEPLFKEYAHDRRLLPLGHGWLVDRGKQSGFPSTSWDVEVELALFRPTDGARVAIPVTELRSRRSGALKLLGPDHLRVATRHGTFEDIMLPPEAPGAPPRKDDGG